MRLAPLALWALASCQGLDDHAAAAAGDPPAPPVVVAAPALKDHMRDHFAAVSDLQRAIARGHLDEARRHASWLATHDEIVLPGWKPYVDELDAAAIAVRDAKDLPAAAAVAGRLGRACSRCHEARSALVSFLWSPPPPEDDPTLANQMKRHQWAAARLWEGLVAPSEELWSEGTHTLATTRLDLAATGGAGRPEVLALALRLRELAAHGAKLADHDQRARWYGELLSTCATCHTLVRPAPVKP